MTKYWWGIHQIVFETKLLIIQSMVKHLKQVTILHVMFILVF